MATRHLLLVGVVAMAALAACEASERGTQADSDSKPTAAEGPIRWTVNLAAPDEPGERLVMQGRVLDPKRVAVAGVEMEVYHADSAGMYTRNSSERPRLFGRLRTSAEGRYEIHTVMPGSYGGPAHVHVTVRPPWGGAQYFMVNVPPPPPPRHAPRATKPSRIDWLAPPHSASLVRDSSGVLRLQHDFVVGR